MLGYITNKKDYFKGNLLEFNLKKAVSFSGGTNQHYNFFKGILNYSITSKNTSTHLHDIKAGEFSLFLFPLKIQCLLSVIFYNYEKKLTEEFKTSNLQINNILLPSEQLSFNSIITQNSISDSVYNIIDDTVLNNYDLNILFDYFNLKNIELNLNANLTSATETILNSFNYNFIFKEEYLTIIKNNDRLKVILLAAQNLNYKPQSLQYLTEALTIWQQTSSI